MKFNYKREQNEIYKTLLSFKQDIFDKSINDSQLFELATKFSKHATFITLSESEKEKGYIAFYCNDNESKTAFISMIVVGNEYQGLGFGYGLFNEACKVSKTNGMEFLKLEVNKNNVSAIRFYEKLGMKLKISTEFYYLYQITLK